MVASVALRLQTVVHDALRHLNDTLSRGGIRPDAAADSYFRVPCGFARKVLVQETIKKAVSGVTVIMHNYSADVTIPRQYTGRPIMVNVKFPRYVAQYLAATAAPTENVVTDDKLWP